MHPLLPVGVAATVGVALTVALANPPSGVGARASGPLGVAGITYDPQSARPLDELGDAAVIRALPPSERRASRGRVLYPLVFSIPRASARDGALTLRVFDPTGATPPAGILVQSA
jgi:hypothetical protein